MRCEMNRETLEPHEFTCSACGKSFESRDRGQLASSRAGRNVFCGVECRRAKEREMQRKRPGRHVCGPCPTCGEVFRSRTKGKRFCSLECYTTSDELRQRLAKHSYEIAKDWKCAHCGNDAPRKRKFCNDFCRRRYFAERFDRFIANPEDIALPQNFDEFLNRDELPCLIDGCDWVGVKLGQHINITHGIPQEKFKEMVGFNRRTALMGVAAREERSRIMTKLIEEGVIEPCAFPIQESDRSRGELRLEGREHWRKSIAMSGGQARFIAAGIARSKSDEGRKVSSERLKQTIAETPKVKMKCVECGCEYETLETHRGRSKYCSQKCRNTRNNRNRRQASA